MKRSISFILILALALLCFVGCSNGKQSTDDNGKGNKNDVVKVDYTAEQLLDKVIEKAIEIDPDTEYGMSKLVGQKNEINLDNLEDILGLTEEEFNNSIDSAMESKPDDTWSPHSIVFIKVKENVDVAETAEKIVKNTSPYRFGCLKPDVIMGAFYDRYIVLIDSDEAAKDVVLKSFEDIIGNETTKVTRDND